MSEGKEKYQPSPEEMKKAEGMMTPIEKAMTRDRAVAKEWLDKIHTGSMTPEDEKLLGIEMEETCSSTDTPPVEFLSQEFGELFRDDQAFEVVKRVAMKLFGGAVPGEVEKGSAAQKLYHFASLVQGLRKDSELDNLFEMRQEEARLVHGQGPITDEELKKLGLDPSQLSGEHWFVPFPKTFFKGFPEK